MTRHLLAALLALGLGLGVATRPAEAAGINRPDAVVQPVQFYGYYGRGFYGGPGYGYYGRGFYRPGFYGRGFYGPGFYGRGIFYGRGYGYGPGFYGRGYYGGRFYR